MSLRTLFNPAKDFALEVAVKLWFNQTHKRYGQMTSIQIDSTAKSIHLELELKGESAPLRIDVRRYELTTKAGETHLELGAIETSREWLNALLEDLLPPTSRRFKLPGSLRALL
jgi:hypothetical protein